MEFLQGKNDELQVDNLVSKRVSGKFVTRTALDEEAALRVNPLSTVPIGENLNSAILGPLENVDIGFRVGRRLIALEFLHHDTLMKLAPSPLSQRRNCERNDR